MKDETSQTKPPVNREAVPHPRYLDRGARSRATARHKGEYTFYPGLIALNGSCHDAKSVARHLILR